MITLYSVLLATIAPKQLEPLVSSGEGIASVLLSLFFAAVGKGHLHSESCPHWPRSLPVEHLREGLRLVILLAQPF